MNESLLNDKLDLAKLYFRTSDYARALALYNDIVSLATSYSSQDIVKLRNLYGVKTPILGGLIHPKLISILDQRAATHEKLGDISACISDCERAMKLDPASLKSYLRLGKNYSKQNNHLRAYKIYQNGLYFIEGYMKKYPQAPINEATLTKLKAGFSAVNQYLKSQKPPHRSSKKRRTTVDPFVYLSHDVLELIFAQLSLTDLLKCHLVSRTWYTALTSISSLYTHINLRQRISAKQFHSCANFVSKFSRNRLNLYISTTESEKDLWRIVEKIIVGKYSLSRIEIINHKFDVTTFLSKLDKYDFKLKFQHLHTFKFISPKFAELEDILLNLCPNLKTLEILFTGESPKVSPFKNKMVIKQLSIEAQSPLETLVMINRSQSPLYPPLISKKFCDLSTLIVTCFNFNNIQHIFGQFVAELSVSTIILENNRNFSFKQFLQNLINYEPQFQLKKLVFREYAVDKPLSLNEFTNNDFPSLKSLTYLDLFSSSLTNKGLLKFLKTVNASLQLEKLILGYSNYISLKNDQINNIVKITLGDILQAVPTLTSLSLVNLNIDDLSLKLFNQDLKHLGNKTLQYLDVSCNLNITGFGLINLFDGNPTNFKRVIVHGVDINKSTINHITKKYHCQLDNDHMRTSWRKYGVNSFVPDVRD